MQNYSVDQLIKDKKAQKKALIQDLKLSKKAKVLLAIILDKELSKNEESLVNDILAGLKNLEINVVILADSNLDLSADGNVILPYNRHNRKKLLEAADMALIFNFSDTEEMLVNGVIPISLDRDGLIDYDPNREQGNSFIYKDENVWSIFATLVRAFETFKFPYDWKHIVRQGISRNSAKSD